MTNMNKAALIGIALGLAGIVWLHSCDVTPTAPVTPTATSVPTATPEPQGLVNSDFEDGCTQNVVHLIDWGYRDNICAPSGWVVWWRQGGGEGGDYGQPEVQLTFGNDPVNGWTAELPRLHDGMHGLHLFTMCRPHDAGLYGLVSVTPGATVRLVAWAETWTCSTDEHLGYTCIDTPWDQVQVAVGLGDTPNPAAATWSDWQTAPDEWAMIGPVEHTVGGNGVVVVFLRSWAKWGFKHLDVYWDDALLVVQ
jgi:hypothetical protein